MAEAAAVFRRRVGELLTRTLSAGSWSLTVTPHRVGMSINAGGTASMSWYQRDADGPLPAVYVVDGAVLLRESLAIPSLEWSGSLLRLEKVLNGRPWVRVPLDLVAARDPACLPVIWAMREFDGRIGARVSELGPDPARGLDRFEVYRDGHWDKVRATWELGSNPPSLTITDDPWDRLELSFTAVECPFRLPEAGEIVDAEEVWAQGAATTPRRRPAEPKGYQVSIEESENDEDEGFPWTLRDEDLADALDVENNVEAEDLIREAVAERNAKLAKKIKFDSEGDCFFAYAGSATAAGQLAQLIADLVQERRRAAQI